MIIKRQKTYSGKGTQILFRLKKAANQAGTAFNNAGLKTGERVKEIITGKPTVNPNFKFRPKSNTQLKRETVQQVKGAQETAKNVAKGVYYTPGQMLDKGIKYTAENPIAATGNAASVVLPAVNPIWAAIPVGGPSIGVEAAAKKAGFYKRGTQKLGEIYGNSKVSKNLRLMPSLPETASRVGQLIPL